MITTNWFSIPCGLLVAALGIGRAGGQTTTPSARIESPPLDAPATDLEPIPNPEPLQVPEARQVPNPPAPGLAADPHPDKRVYAPKEPPAPIVERPVGRRPSGRVQWIRGYWEWDPVQSGYEWVAGSWQIPPQGSFWVDSRWLRDAKGWYRMPGFWTRRRDRAVVETDLAVANQPAWRATAPPSDHPDDTPKPAPGPDYFFIPGHYRPNGDQLDWTAGCWARVQPGWDWVPARGVRRADGWQFRDGTWVPDPSSAVVARNGGYRRMTAPPPPPAADSAPAGGGRPPGAIADREGDPIVGPIPDIELDDAPVVVIGPRVGMPFYVIRPQGAYPYGPGGVIVPGVVPPFVRRLLDRVLP